jgi:hypothetical protein
MLSVNALGIFTFIVIFCEYAHLMEQDEASHTLLHNLLVKQENGGLPKKNRKDSPDFLAKIKELLIKYAKEKNAKYPSNFRKEETNAETKTTPESYSREPQSAFDARKILGNNGVLKSTETGNFLMRMVDHRGGKTFKAVDAVNPKTSKVAEDLLEEDTHDYHPKPIQGKPGAENRRSFLEGENRLWTNGMIPYKINENVDLKCQEEILAAIAVFHNNTCVRWKPYSNDSDEDHVEFFMSGISSSYVGNIEVTKYGHLYEPELTSQPITIESSHCTLHVVLHEMAHTLGMTHEQSRSDRDGYVTVYWEHVLRGKENQNLAKEETNNQNIPYDYSSLMHYSIFAFSKDGEKTLEYRDTDYEFLGLQENSLSFYDIEDITKAYKCAKSCPDLECLNAGFVDHTCSCRCPDYLQGERCEDVTSSCGGIVELQSEDDHRTILSPNYPELYSLGESCMWLVRAPQGMQIELTSNDFDLPDNSLGRCRHWLEIRSISVGQPGPLYCGNSFSLIETPSGSESQLLLLKFDSSYRFTESGRGFNLTVTAKLDPNRLVQEDSSLASFQSSAVTNYCDKHPDWCYNGGTCVFDDGDVSCICPDQFSGASCEHSKNAVETTTQRPDDLGTYLCEPSKECTVVESNGEFRWEIVNDLLTVVPQSGSKGDEAQFNIPLKIVENREMCLRFVVRPLDTSEACSVLEVTYLVEGTDSHGSYQYDMTVHREACGGSEEEFKYDIWTFDGETTTISFKTILQENSNFFNVAIERISVNDGICSY